MEQSGIVRCFEKFVRLLQQSFGFYVQRMSDGLGDDLCDGPEGLTCL